MKTYKEQARYLYLIKRGDRPDYHKAPYHPVVITSRKGVAEWTAGSSADGADVWTKENNPGMGWVRGRWKGFDLVGRTGQTFSAPDGSVIHAVVHDKSEEPYTLLKGAVWWSTAKMPQWLEDAGVIYPPDEFSRRRIIEETNADLELKDPYWKKGRAEAPGFWPKTTVRS